jgi:hypothetical protein
MKRLFVLCLLLAVPLMARQKPVAALSGISSVFVQGNNQAAEKARDDLSKSNSCLALATKASDADAVLDISVAMPARDNTMQGLFGPATSIVSATLTMKSGDLVWSKSERYGDTPLRSGAKIAGGLIIKDLIAARGCEKH